MGTNFYIQTPDKYLAQKYAPWDYTLTDAPDWGYRIHVAKTSAGWLPLFQSHSQGAKSVADYKDLYDTGRAQIFDEYGVEYDWAAFEKRVLKFNGGILGANSPEPCDNPTFSPVYDPNLPEFLPITHMPGTKQSYNYKRSDYLGESLTFFTDSEGYEFDINEFL